MILTYLQIRKMMYEAERINGQAIIHGEEGRVDSYDVAPAGIDARVSFLAGPEIVSIAIVTPGGELLPSPTKGKRTGA